MENHGQRHRPGLLLAVLFILYGGAHLIALSFVWIIFLALGFEGYQMSSEKMVMLAGASLLMVLPSLLSAYSLLRRSWFAKRVVLATSLSILVIPLVALLQIPTDRLSAFSTTRIVVIGLYALTGIALCIYGVSSVRRMPALGVESEKAV
jgi:hypothetical protein